MNIIRNRHGFSIVQILVAVGILAALMVASLNFFRSQMRANNFLEFQGKREELRQAIIGQFLKDTNNCKCLFNTRPPFDTTTPSTVTANNNAQLGLVQFTVPGNCGGATVPAPFETQMGGITVSGIQLTNITNVAGNFSAALQVTVTSAKEVAGPTQVLLSIPVAVQTVPVGPTQARVDGCSLDSSGVIPQVGTCPAGQFVTGYDPTGVMQCGPPTYQ